MAPTTMETIFVFDYLSGVCITDRWSYTLASLDPPPQPGNPRSRVHLIIIAKGAGGAARCPLNRSSTTSAPPPRNYESLRAGFHRGNTPGTHRVLHAKE
ncbi:hypothetical protein EAG_04833 [Camponotus floridanus]|uniref:Uncharacterized protein n=1 Tax=Camponotus floridanus TaxID=104421 RepID=E2AGV8_CAMFO|nr:hypothetical protein EAG_04833 [Camponotus floridanus]